MESTSRLHPLLAAAAISVLVASAAGVGALTGLMPHSSGTPKPVESAVTTVLAQPLAPAAIAATPVPLAVPPSAPPAKPAKKPLVRASAPAAAAQPARASDALPDLEYPRSRAAGPTLEPAVVAAPKCLNCGTVEDVREIEQKGEGSGLGAVAGGVAGAVVGKQFGSGSGRTILTLLGAAGGAYAGHEVEKRVRSTKRWEVSVRLDDGSTRTVSLESPPAWRSGDRVRYVNGALEPERA